MDSPAELSFRQIVWSIRATFLGIDARRWVSRVDVSVRVLSSSEPCEDILGIVGSQAVQEKLQCIIYNIARCK